MDNFWRTTVSYSTTFGSFIHRNLTYTVKNHNKGLKFAKFDPNLPIFLHGYIRHNMTHIRDILQLCPDVMQFKYPETDPY